MKVGKAPIYAGQVRMKRVSPVLVRVIPLVLTLLIIAWSIYPLNQRFEQQREVRDLRHELTTMKQKNKALQKEIMLLNDPDYIELLARKDFGLVKPDEEAYILTRSFQEVAKISEPDSEAAAPRTSLLEKIKGFLATRF